MSHVVVGVFEDVVALLDSHRFDGWAKEFLVDEGERQFVIFELYFLVDFVYASGLSLHFV